MEMNYVKLCSKLSLTMLPEESTSVNVNHSLSQSGQAIYYLRPSTLAQWQYASQQQNSLLITKKEGSYEIIEHPTLLDCHIYSGHDTMVGGFRVQ